MRRQAAVMLVAPATLSRPKAELRRAAMTRGMLSVCTWERSSSNVTSRTLWARFSICQWQRTATRGTPLSPAQAAGWSRRRPPPGASPPFGGGRSSARYETPTPLPATADGLAVRRWCPGVGPRAACPWPCSRVSVVAHGGSAGMGKSEREGDSGVHLQVVPFDHQDVVAAPSRIVRATAHWVGSASTVITCPASGRPASTVGPQ